MKIDPEVAALLDDLPATKLPEALVEEGWGQQTMADAQRNSVWEKTHKPSTVFQPTFEPCAQCGIPVTEGRHGEMTDHVGRTECDGALVDERYIDQHITASKMEETKKWTTSYRGPPVSTWRQEYLAGPCSATRSPPKHDHTHECNATTGHFGFHECKVCRHLWH